MPYKDVDKQREAVKAAQAKWHRVMISFLENEEELYARIAEDAKKKNLRITALIKQVLEEHYPPTE